MSEINETMQGLIRKELKELVDLVDFRFDNQGKEHKGMRDSLVVIGFLNGDREEKGGPIIKYVGKPIDFAINIAACMGADDALKALLLAAVGTYLSELAGKEERDNFTEFARKKKK